MVRFVGVEWKAAPRFPLSHLCLSACGESLVSIKPRAKARVYHSVPFVQSPSKLRPAQPLPTSASLDALHFGGRWVLFPGVYLEPALGIHVAARAAQLLWREHAKEQGEWVLPRKKA